MLRFRLSTGLRICAGLACAWCGLLRAGAGPALPHPIAIQLKWYPQYQFAGYYAAKHGGLYKAEGLDVSLRSGGRGISPVKEVIEGRAQFGVADSDLLLARAKGEPVVVLGAVFQHSPYILLTRAEDRITKPSDFAGKTVMALEDQGATQFRAMLLREGVDLAKVRVIRHSWNLHDLVDGKVDAMTAYLTVEPFQLKKLGVEPGVVRPADYGIDFYGDCLFTTEAEIRDHPDEVESVLRATRAGWDQAMRDPGQVIPWIAAMPGVKDRGITEENLAYEAKAMQPLVLADVVPVGHMNPDRWQHILETYKDLGLVPKNMSLGGFLYSPERGTAPSRLVRWTLLSLLGLALVLAAAMAWITLLRRAVRARTRDLKREQARLLLAQHSLDQAPDFISWVNEEGRYLYANQTLLSLYGLTLEELKQRRAWDQIPWLTEAEWPIRWAALQREGIFTGDITIHAHDGREVPVHVVSMLVESGGQQIVCHIGRDLTEFRRVEAERHDRDARLSLILEGAGVGYWDWRIPTGELEMDHTLDRMLGYAPGQLPRVIGTWFDHLHPEDRDRTMAILSPFLDKPQGVYNNEFRLRKEDGSWVWVQARGRATEVDGDGKTLRLQGIIQDIDERKRTEAGLQQMQRLESLGLMAGGIAHDFNNLLTAVAGNLNLVKLDAASDPKALDHLAKAEAAVQQAASLSRQMLAYSGKGRLAVGSIDLNEAVSLMRGLLEVGLAKDVKLEASLSAEPPVIEGDATQIQQVVLNLITNAAEAIGAQSGTIRVSTGLARMDGSEPMRYPVGVSLPVGTYAELRVSDTGAGMTPEVQARIFDPFFTTKATGRGLGLSALLGIIRGHRGGIQMESVPGQGTTFRLFFPLGAAPAAAPLPPPPEPRGTHLSGMALIADDEPGVLEAGAALLEALGFTVIQARDGEAAVAGLLDHLNEVRIVVLDQTMPRLSGTDTFRAIRRIRPDLPVILSSGFSEEEVGDTLRAEGLDAFLQKPYRLADLERAVRKALSS